MPLDLHYKGVLPELVKLQNIAEELDDADLRVIGAACREEFISDKTSRARWEEDNAEGMKLALQVTEDKTFPWPNCSNVKFPLITIAAIHFHARAYPVIVNGKQVVTYQPIGEDKDGAKLLRAKRVTDHQNFLLLEETDWEEQTDKELINVPLVGCCFKKTLYDRDRRLPNSKLVLASDLVVPYYTSSLELTPRISEMFSLSPNAFRTRVLRGMYLDQTYSPSYMVSSDPLTEAKQDAQKLDPVANPADMPTEFVEQHRYLDLDGDGYGEPYIVTFVRETGQICRIVARFTMPDVEKNTKGEVVHIEPLHFYTKIPFIPSPDGGFYDLGFISLLGPLNHAADSLINQLIDAGTMATLGGGFMGRGVKIKRGENTFAPYEWKSVESPGVSLKDNIVPLAVREPSRILLDLLIFLIQYAERISSANEVQSGEMPDANAKSGVWEIANANGLKIFAAIYKRIWRAKKEEFYKFYKITAAYKDVQEKGGRNPVTRQWFNLEPDDYKMPPEGIWPAADPNIASKEQAQKQAGIIMQTAANVPGHDMWQATMRFYKAHDVPNPEELFPNPKGPNAIPQAPNPKLLDSQTKAQMAQGKLLDMQLTQKLKLSELLQRQEESQAKVFELYAKANLESAQAKGVDVGHTIALIDAEIAAEKQRSEHVRGMIDILKELITSGPQTAGDTATDTGGTGVSGVATPTGNSKVLSLSAGPTGMAQGAMG